MGTIIEKNNKWTVQIRHKGYKSLSAVFTSYDKAKEFNDKIELEFILKKEAKTIKNSASRIKELKDE